jgi:hypothetical protein
MMRPSAKEHARKTDPLELKFRNLVRRYVVTAARGAFWKILGVRLPDGNETNTIELFSGIGFYATPPASGKPEVIVVNVGNAKAPVIVATRDWKTLKAVLAQLGEVDAGSTIVHNGAAVLYMRPNGTVEIRTPGGTAKRLATVDDVQAVRDDLHLHEHLYVPPGGPPAVTTTGGPAVTAPVGTTVLKGE